MNFFKRSLKYIKAKKIKTVLFAIIFILLGNLVIIGFGVSKASTNAKNIARKKMNPVVKYEENYSNYFSDEIVYVNLKIMDEMANDSRVKASSSVITSEAKAINFDPVKPEIKEDIFEGLEEDESNDKTITLKGTRYSNMIEFENGTYEMVEGKFISKDDLKNKNKVVVIEEELAKNNNLHIGDLIDINILEDYVANELGVNIDDGTITVKIIGIYKSNVEAENSYYQAGYKANVILFPTTAITDEILNIAQKEYDYYYKLYSDELEKIEIKEELLYSNGLSLLLNDPNDLDKFVNDYQTKIGKNFKLNTNDEIFKKYSKPLDTISLFANIIVWALLINSVIIITLVTALTLKSREYEIGVLVSLGVQKWKVIAQLFLEILIIALISFAVASVSGSLISKGVGQKVLDIQSSFSGDDDKEENIADYYYADTDYFSELNKDSIISEYKVAIDAGLIIKIFLVGILVVFVSILIPALMILRYNPKQILMTTN